MTTEPTDRPRRTPANDEIPSLLEALAAAGGNVAAFTRTHGLAPWKLYEAQRVARGVAPRRQRRRKAGSEFVRVRVVEGPSASLELMLGSGHRLLIPRGFDETTLRQVIGVLSSC